ncbi:unnamed protein product [Polarella glacialis]|uniref:tRNA/rRNA methyltransferase SpoU type domain-containing protein n=2 Tax=Polarella glacialis TaxID=89957 RepID=A0A813DIU4_POLGL|nr:unnamed protein product [Polarella glacialis]
MAVASLGWWSRGIDARLLPRSALVRSSSELSATSFDAPVSAALVAASALGVATASALVRRRPLRCRPQARSGSRWFSEWKGNPPCADWVSDWEHWEWTKSAKASLRRAELRKGPLSHVQKQGLAMMTWQVKREQSAGADFQPELLDRIVNGEAVLPPGLGQPLAHELEELVDDGWVQRVNAILPQRTSSVRLVFDGPGSITNSWACMRTMDSFGVQVCDVVHWDTDSNAQRNEQFDKVLLSQPWVTVKRWPDMATCIKQLHAEGYLVLALDLAPGSEDLEALLPRLSSVNAEEARGHARLAVVIGNEIDGISPATRGLADLRGFLPMSGMSQSFNFSVACAVLLSLLDFHGFLRPGQLDTEECSALRLRWLLMACVEDGPQRDSAEQLLARLSGTAEQKNTG